MSEESQLFKAFQSAHRIFVFMSYPIPFILQAMIYWPPTVKNATAFKRIAIAVWLCLSGPFYYSAIFYGSSYGWLGFFAKHFAWFYFADYPGLWMVLSASILEDVFTRKSTNRLFGADKPSIKGKRIVVLGNGPSMVKGEPLGDLIDGMDEVIRFNNFQTKTSGSEKWTGHKTTVHFSDSMLYPTFPEYHAPGATVALSLFMDRLMVAGSYPLFRGAGDLYWRATVGMLMDPSLGFLPHEDINVLKEVLGISHWKHPTSGCLAIDWFVRNRPDDSVPIYIHGFDFFEGPEIHYYNKTEPLYERLNDLIGVTSMHQPEKEKAFVARLVAEGKVKWLKDLKSEQ